MLLCCVLKVATMTQFLPPNLLALFAPRDAIKYIPPTERLPFEKRTVGYGGIATYLNLFEVGAVVFMV